MQTVLLFGVLGLYFVTAVLHVGFDWFSLPCRKVTKVPAVTSRITAVEAPRT